MMLLVIDVGNSSMVWAIGDDDKAIHKQWRVPTDVGNSIDDYHRLCDDQLYDTIDKVVIASVVPAVNAVLETYCLSFAAEVIWANIDTIDLQVALPNPQEVGADRLVDAYSAYRIYKQDCIVVDFGTATTCELVTSEGIYMGGTISPGIELSLKALHMGTAKLPEISLAKPENIIGKSTVEAIQSGMYWGYVGLVESLVKRMQDSFGMSCKIIATGGMASFLAKDIDMIDEVDQDLTLKGLLLIGSISS